MNKRKNVMKTEHNREHDLSEDLAKIKAALAEATEDVKSKANAILMQSLEDVKEKSVDVKNDISQYISEKPLTSLGLAALAGAIIGYLIRK